MGQRKIGIGVREKEELDFSSPIPSRSSLLPGTAPGRGMEDQGQRAGISRASRPSTPLSLILLTFVPRGDLPCQFLHSHLLHTAVWKLLAGDL